MSRRRIVAALLLLAGVTVLLLFVLFDGERVPAGETGLPASIEDPLPREAVGAPERRPTRGTIGEESRSSAAAEEPPQMLVHIVEAPALHKRKEEVPIAGASLSLLVAGAWQPLGRTDERGSLALEPFGQEGVYEAHPLLAAAPGFISKLERCPPRRRFGPRNASGERAMWYETVVIALEPQSASFTVDLRTEPEHPFGAEAAVELELSILTGTSQHPTWMGAIYSARAALEDLREGGLIAREHLPLSQARSELVVPSSTAANRSATRLANGTLKLCARRNEPDYTAIGTLALANLPAESSFDLGELPMFGIRFVAKLCEETDAAPLPLSKHRGKARVEIVQHRRHFSFWVGDVPFRDGELRLRMGPECFVAFGSDGRHVERSRPDEIRVVISGDERYADWWGNFHCRDVSDGTKLRVADGGGGEEAKGTYQLVAAAGEGCFDLESEIVLTPKSRVRIAQVTLELTTPVGVEPSAALLHDRGCQRIPLHRGTAAPTDVRNRWVTKEPIQVRAKSGLLVVEAQHEGRWIGWSAPVSRERDEHFTAELVEVAAYEFEVRAPSELLPDFEVSRYVERLEASDGEALLVNGLRTKGARRFTLPSQPSVQFFSFFSAGNPAVLVRDPKPDALHVIEWPH